MQSISTLSYLRQDMRKPKLRWSYFELPGFVRARDGGGFVPMHPGEDGDDRIRTE